jgi:hypothetical protein
MFLYLKCGWVSEGIVCANKDEGVEFRFTKH